MGQLTDRPKVSRIAATRSLCSTRVGIPRANPWLRWPWVSALLLIVLAALPVFMSGQQERLADPANSLHVPVLTFGPQGTEELVGLPDDWTHHRLVFSNPGTEEEAIKAGSYDEWLRIVSNPRYIMQQLKRRTPAQGPGAEYVERMNWVAREQQAAEEQDLSARQAEDSVRLVKDSGPVRRHLAIHRDWSMDMGSGAKVGAGMCPAKYSFSTTSTANCGSATSPDYVVFNTSVAGSSSQASIVAYYNLYSSCSGQVPSVYWAFNTGGTVSTSIVLSGDGSQLAFVQTPASGNAQLVLLRWAATPPGRTVTGSVTDSSTSFTISSGTLTSMDVGAGISGTGIPAGETIATVTSGTAGTLTTAATATHSGESLSITADAGGPDSLTAVANSSYYGCTAPCMTTLSFSGTSRSDSVSSPFYDYHSDTLFVGDASGGLHKFTPVFNGTPAEVGSPWASPSTIALSSPVSNGTDVFVGDAGGYLYSVNVTSAAVTKSVEVATSPGIVDGPLVDPAAGQVYAFVATDMNGQSGVASGCGNENRGVPSTTQCDGVINLPMTFTSTTEFTESITGVGTTNVLYAGAFDNQYWSTGTGNLYVNSSTGANYPKLMEVPLTTSGFSTHACQSGTTPPPNASAVQCAINIDNPMTSAVATGGPVTEILNGSTDYIFTSVTAYGSLTGCTGSATEGCIYSYNATSTLAANAAPAAGAQELGGTSGIIIDNTLTTGGASQVYFSTLSNGTCTTSGTLSTGGCAVQAAQSGL